MFLRRSAFVIIANFAVHRREMKDGDVLSYLDLINEHSNDERKYDRKGIDWALRQVGKRNARLNRKATSVAEILMRSPDRVARWMGSNSTGNPPARKLLEGSQKLRKKRWAMAQKGLRGEVRGAARWALCLV